MLFSFLERNWFVLPVFSGLLLILSLYPYDLWPLAFVALVPLYFFAAAFKNLSLRQVFAGGCIAGGMFALPMSFSLVVGFQWMPDTHIFTTLMRASFILITALGALSCGLVLASYRLLRCRSPLLNSLAGAALYVTGEMILYCLYSGYNFAILAYAAVSVSAFMLAAGFGGLFLVSFLVAWSNTLAAEALAAPSWRRALPALVFLAGLAAFVFSPGIANLLQNRTGMPVRTLSVAVIQLGDVSNQLTVIGKESNGVFSLPGLEKTLSDAGQGAPDLLLYPFSPVGGFLYDTQKPTLPYGVGSARKEAVAAWLKSLVPTSTTAAIWTDYYKEPEYFNELEFFKDGVSTATYRKRDISPFFDYVPAWVRRLGFGGAFKGVASGGAGQTILLQDAVLGGAICSEIYQQSLARGDSKSVSVIISPGSEGFVGNAARVYSLKAAQFRAAENNIPVVRANLLGPSAIIARDGSIIAQTTIDERTTMHGNLELRAPAPTPFSRFGNAPLYIIFALILAAAGILKNHVAADKMHLVFKRKRA